MMGASTATKLNAKITGSSQPARQADGSSPLKVLGETRLHFTRDEHELYFEGLVVENLDTEVLAGIPFMEMNDISIRPSRREVCIGNKMYTRMDHPPFKLVNIQYVEQTSYELHLSQLHCGQGILTTHSL